jgi:syntaxin-binding protein 1
VYGEKNSKELIAFLAEQSTALDTLDKMRLFLCYLATHPEKLDATKHSQWAKLARLSANEMNTVCNLAYLGVAVMKTSAWRVAAEGCACCCVLCVLHACSPR